MTAPGTRHEAGTAAGAADGAADAPVPLHRSGGTAVWRTVVRVVLVASVLAAMGGEIHAGLHTTSSLRRLGGTPGATLDERQTACWASEVRHLVPRDAEVYVGAASVASQRLSEALTLWAVPTGDPGAGWSVTLQPSPAGTCEGTTVVATRR